MKRVFVLCLSLGFLLLLVPSLFAQEIVEIVVKGISDATDSGAQRDRLEAMMDAKRQACEKAGVQLASKTTVENFQILFDYIESQSEAILMPGFQVIDVGYVKDGTYQVVLSGKIKVAATEEPLSTKQMRYAKSLNHRGKNRQCEAILKQYIDSTDEKVPEILKEEALYCYIRWGYSFDVMEDYYKFEAYYPQSRYLSLLEGFASYAARPLVKYKTEFNPRAADWQAGEFTYKGTLFSQNLTVIEETIPFKDFKGRDHSVLLTYTLLNAPDYAGYRLILRYYPGVLDTVSARAAAKGQLLEIRNHVYKTKHGRSGTFQTGLSPVRFKHFKISNLQIKGRVPQKEGAFEQQIVFNLAQRSF